MRCFYLHGLLSDCSCPCGSEQSRAEEAALVLAGVAGKRCAHSGCLSCSGGVGRNVSLHVPEPRRKPVGRLLFGLPALLGCGAC